MKFSCKTKDLVESVSNVQRAVSVKSTISALEGIFIKTSFNSIELCGYDLELGIKTAIPAFIEQQGIAVINARIFSDIVRKLPDEELTVEVDKNLITTIRSGKSEFSIMANNASDFPEIPQILDACSTELPSMLLKNMIKQTIFSVTDSDTSQIHTGSLFELENNKLTIVSVDGFRLAMRTEEITNSQKLSFVIPKKTLNEIIRLIPDDEESRVILSVGKRHLILLVNEYQIFSRLLDGEFLDYKAAIPINSCTELTVDTKAFIDSVERVSLLITDRIKCPLRCLISENEIKLSCVTNIGKATDEILADVAGDDVDIGFNSKYLLDALKNSEVDKVKLELNGSVSPIKIMPTDKDNFLFLILPIRIKSE